MLFHIHKNSLLLFPNSTQVAFNARALGPILQDTVFSWICLSKNMLSLHLTTSGILARGLLYIIAAVSGLNHTLLWLPFFLSTLLYSQHAQTNFNSTK